MFDTAVKGDLSTQGYSFLKKESFKIALFEFLIRAKGNLILPEYKGNTLRGGLGNALREIVCNMEGEDCTLCPLKNKCAWHYLFDTSPPPGSRKLSNLSDIPRPFVVEAPLDSREFIEKGDYLKFNLALTGNSINYYPYFAAAFRKLGNMGIGRRSKDERLQGKFDLVKIYSLGINGDRSMIYDGDRQLFFDDIIEINGGQFSEEKNSSKDSLLKLNFLTPTKIRIKKRYVIIPTFENIIIILTRRLNNLLRFHCGVDEEWNFRKLKDEASKIKTKSHLISWVEYDRYSRRKKARDKTEGFVGEITFTGSFKSFIPFLKLGELLHLGKGTTWGMGKYRIEVK